MTPKERLEKLAARLLTVPSSKFDMEEWRTDVEGRPYFDMSDGDLLDPGCGTSGCAVGWACSMPEFNAEGLIWDRGLPVYLGPGKAAPSWSGVQAFFGIERAQADFLFSIESYSTQNVPRQVHPREVSERITEFVRGIEMTHEYLFDVKLFASIRVTAASEAEARATLLGNVDCVDCSAGEWPDGSPISFEASVDDCEIPLIEIDGEYQE